MAALVYHRTAERPDVAMWVRDVNDALIDLTGYSFTFKIGPRLGAAAVFTKTTGITGAVGAGAEPTGTPNVVITFTAAELDAVPAHSNYVWMLRATSGGVDRVYDGKFILLDVVT